MKKDKDRQKEYIEERQQARVKILSFPAALLPDNSFTGFLNETGGGKLQSSIESFLQEMGYID
jgi:hypothetical protein